MTTGPSPLVDLGRLGRWAALAQLLLLTGMASAAGGCITPPVILPGGTGAPLSAESYPAGTELLLIPVQDGVALRGVFVPSDPGAPVVLHLLESRGSVGFEAFAWAIEGGYAGTISRPRSVFESLSHLGFASLALDYQGVGVSDGERTPEHLRQDALAGWEAALRRAGGHPQRVIVRATSIGTLAAAQLLDAGCEPAGLVLASPVFSDTVAGNFGRVVHGAFLTALASPFLTDVTEVDLDAALAAHHPPHMAWVLAGDELLPEDDLLRLRQVVEASGGELHLAEAFQEHRELPDVVQLPRHVRGALASHDVLPGEREFLQRLFPELPPTELRASAGRARLPAELLQRFPPGSPESALLDQQLGWRLGDEPLLMAWCVLGGVSPDDTRRVLDYYGGVVAGWRAASSAQALSRRLATDDPAGPLPLLPMLELARRLDTYARLAAPMSVDGLLEMVAGCGAPGVGKAIWNPQLTTQEGHPFHMRHDLRARLWDPISRGGEAPPEVAARRLLRVVFKAADREERVQLRADGSHVLQVLDGDAWREVDPVIVLAPRGG